MKAIETWEVESAINEALPGADRALILDRFVQVNPHWQGARFDDVLEGLYTHEAYLDVTEPLFEIEPELADLPGAGYAATALAAADRKPLTAGDVLALLWKARLLAPTVEVTSR